MIEIFDKQEIADILWSFGWWDTDPIDYSIKPEEPTGLTEDDAIQDFIVQNCLAHIFTAPSDIAYTYVPQKSVHKTTLNLSKIFTHVYQIGERENYCLFQVSNVRSNRHDFYNNVIERGRLHSIFIDSWRNYRQPNRACKQEDIYVKYIPDTPNFKPNPVQNSDILHKYISEFSSPILLSISAVFDQAEIEEYQLFSTLYARGYKVTFCGSIDNDNVFTSKTMGLYLE